MATIDSRIAMGFQPQTQLESPVNALARVLQVQGLQQQTQLGQMKMDEARRGQERQNRLASLLQGQYETPEARESALMSGGFIDEATGLQKSRADAMKAQADVGKTKAETEKLALNNAMEKVKFAGQLLGGVKDQATYDQARAIAQQNGLDVASMPAQYDPQMVSQRLQQAMTVQQRLEQALNQDKYQLDVRRQTETERNNRTQNAISQGNLNVSRERLALDRQTPRGQFIETEQGYMLADPRSGQVQPVQGPDGKPLMGKAAAKNLTEGQAKANLFGSRMVEADRILNELGTQYSPAAIGAKAAAERTPLVGGLLGVGANAMLGENSQKAEQAQRDFINAVLRRESGAVIADSEFDNARKQYFPQPGDSKAVIEQKARNRQTAIAGMTAEIPGGLRSVPTLTSPGGSAPAPAAPGGFKILSVE